LAGRWREVEAGADTETDRICYYLDSNEKDFKGAIELVNWFENFDLFLKILLFIIIFNLGGGGEAGRQGKTWRGTLT
jgi:hypothetical protein